MYMDNNPTCYNGNSVGKPFEPNNNFNKKRPSFEDYKSTKNCEQSSYCDYCNIEDCKQAILCHHAWMSGCEAALFCEATERLSYELCMAKNLGETKEIIESISCLFKSSALKESALATLLNAYNTNKKTCDWNC